MWSILIFISYDESYYFSKRNQFDKKCSNERPDRFSWYFDSEFGLRMRPYVRINIRAPCNIYLFKDNISPKVKQGFTCLQLMAIVKHAYYASFVYQGSSIVHFASNCSFVFIRHTNQNVMSFVSSGHLFLRKLI
jgi:hypothetical protein